MAEFKFSCPQCGQRIQCDPGYAGAQIECPACKQAIVVPQMSAAPAVSRPPAAPPPPPPASAPSALSTRQTTAAPAAGQRFGTSPAGAPPPKPKSKALRNTLIVTSIVVALAVLAGGGWFVMTKSKLFAAKGNPAAMVPKPTAAANSAAHDIFAKMHEAYTNLNSLSIEGSTMMVIDMSEVAPADVNPSAATNKKVARRLTAFMPKGITNATDVVVKLSRPNQFIIESKGTMDFGRMKMTNTMVAWSPGPTNYSLTLSGNNKRYNYFDDRESLLLQVNNQGGGLATSVVQLFFGEPDSMADFMTDWGQTEDQTLDGQACYTLTGKMMGQKLKLWINKSNYLIVQSEVTLGAPVDPAQLQAASDKIDKRTNLSAVQIQKQKDALKTMATVMGKSRGVATETYDTVQVNPTLSTDDFNYSVPSGIKLTHGS